MARVRAAVKRERVFKNTFAPLCEEQELRVSDIVTGMRFGLFKYRHLPLEVRNAVDEEIERMKKEAQKDDETGDWKLMMLDLGIRTARHEEVPKHSANRDVEFAQLIQTPPDLFADYPQGQLVPVQSVPQSSAHGWTGAGGIGFKDRLCVQKRA